MSNEELEAVGRQWLRVVDLAKTEQITTEMEHVRFRDSDLSIKGGALLGFAGLMLAADLVFLSAARDSLVFPGWRCGLAGFAALYLLVIGAICSLVSIMISRHGRYETAWASFGLMKIYHHRRRRWLGAAAVLTIAGTLLYLGSVTLVPLGLCVI